MRTAVPTPSLQTLSAAVSTLVGTQGQKPNKITIGTSTRTTSNITPRTSCSPPLLSKRNYPPSKPKTSRKSTLGHIQQLDQATKGTRSKPNLSSLMTDVGRMAKVPTVLIIDKGGRGNSKPKIKIVSSTTFEDIGELEDSTHTQSPETNLTTQPIADTRPVTNETSKTNTTSLYVPTQTVQFLEDYLSMSTEEEVKNKDLKSQPQNASKVDPYADYLRGNFYQTGEGISKYHMAMSENIFGNGNQGLASKIHTFGDETYNFLKAIDNHLNPQDDKKSGFIDKMLQINPFFESKRDLLEISDGFYIYLDVVGSTGSRYLLDGKTTLDEAVSKVAGFTSEIVRTSYNKIIERSIASFESDLRLRVDSIDKKINNLTYIDSFELSFQLRQQRDKLMFILQNLRKLSPQELGGDGFLVAISKELGPYMAQSLSEFNATLNETLKTVATKYNIESLLQERGGPLSLRVCIASSKEVGNKIDIHRDGETTVLGVGNLEPKIKGDTEKHSVRGIQEAQEVSNLLGDNFVDVLPIQGITSNTYKNNDDYIGGNIEFTQSGDDEERKVEYGTLGIIFPGLGQAESSEAIKIIKAAVPKYISSTGDQDVYDLIRKSYLQAYRSLDDKQKLTLMPNKNATTEADRLSQLEAIDKFVHESKLNTPFHDGFFAITGRKKTIKSILKYIEEGFERKNLGKLYSHIVSGISVDQLPNGTNENKTPVLTTAALYYKQEKYQKQLREISDFVNDLISPIFSDEFRKAGVEIRFQDFYSKNSLAELINRVLAEAGCEFDKPITSSKFRLVRDRLQQEIESNLAGDVIDVCLHKHNIDITDQPLLQKRIYDVITQFNLDEEDSLIRIYNVFNRHFNMHHRNEDGSVRIKPRNRIKNPTLVDRFQETHLKSIGYKFVPFRSGLTASLMRARERRAA